MAKIREDLDGVVVAVGETGESIILRAGDAIPKGIEVGGHVLADSHSTATGAPEANTPVLPPRGGPGSGGEAWRAYGVAAAAAKGFEIDIPADATKTDIIEALKSVDIPVE